MQNFCLCCLVGMRMFLVGVVVVLLLQGTVQVLGFHAHLQPKHTAAFNWQVAPDVAVFTSTFMSPSQSQRSKLYALSESLPPTSTSKTYSPTTIPALLNNIWSAVNEIIPQEIGTTRTIVFEVILDEERSDELTTLAGGWDKATAAYHPPL